MDNLQPFDKLIDSALRSEPMRDVPDGFAGRVMERISVEAAEQARHKTGANRLIRPLLVTGALAAAFLVVPMAAFYGQWNRQALPGGMGLLDYAWAWFDLSLMSSVSAFTVASGIALAVGAVLLTGVWGWSRLRTAERQTNR